MTDRTDTWEIGDAYERYIGRWSRAVAPAFLDWLAAPPRQRWLDVGCGTGALTAAIAGRCAPAALAAVEPSDGFRAAARRNLDGRAEVLAGSATALPLADAAVDVVVSGLVLNFVPDPRAGLVEMARVARPGGTIAAYVWDYAGRMDYLRAFWDAAGALDPAARALDEGVRFPMCRPEALTAAFAAAGLGDVATTAIDVPARFATFEDAWQPFLGGQGPAPSYVASLDPAARERLGDALRARWPAAADGSIELLARAWAARGTVRG